MKKFILFAFIGVFTFSCKENSDTEKETVTEKETANNTTEKTDDVRATNIEIDSNTVTTIDKTKGISEVVDGIYTEYYPGDAKKIKFQGPKDANGQRDGKWLYFSEDGVELSVTNYIHGKRNGPTLVKYPNGNIHYTGEYKNDKTVGVWTTYSPEGVQTSKKDYGNPE